MGNFDMRFRRHFGRALWKELLRRFGAHTDGGTLVLQCVSYYSYVELLNSHEGDVDTVFDHNGDHCRS